MATSNIPQNSSDLSFLFLAATLLEAAFPCLDSWIPSNILISTLFPASKARCPPNCCKRKTYIKTNLDKKISPFECYIQKDLLKFFMAERKGLEPSASGVTGRRYNRLNYRSAWWAVQDLNLRPPPCEGGALPAEPTALVAFLLL